MANLTRHYATTATLEKRLARAYKYLYGDESQKMSDLHRKVIGIGLDVLDAERKESQAARAKSVTEIRRRRITA